MLIALAACSNEPSEQRKTIEGWNDTIIVIVGSWCCSLVHVGSRGGSASRDSGKGEVFTEVDHGWRADLEPQRTVHVQG
jgi:hypothetical protein